MIAATLTLLAGGTRLEVAIALRGAVTQALRTHAELHFEGLQREALRSAYGFSVPSLPSLHYALRETHGRWQATFDVPSDRAARAIEAAAGSGRACGLEVTLVGIPTEAAVPTDAPAAQRPGTLRSVPPTAPGTRRVG